MEGELYSVESLDAGVVGYLSIRDGNGVTRFSEPTVEGHLEVTRLQSGIDGWSIEVLAEPDAVVTIRSNASCSRDGDEFDRPVEFDWNVAEDTRFEIDL